MDVASVASKEHAFAPAYQTAQLELDWHAASLAMRVAALAPDMGQLDGHSVPTRIQTNLHEPAVVHGDHQLAGSGGDVQAVVPRQSQGGVGFGGDAEELYQVHLRDGPGQGKAEREAAWLPLGDGRLWRGAAHFLTPGAAVGVVAGVSVPS